TCPDALADRLRAMAGESGAVVQAGAMGSVAPTSPPAPAPGYAGPLVLARIGRWAPSAVAAVLLIAAGVLFTQSYAPGPGSLNTQAASFLTVDQVQSFTGRHFDCAEQPERMKQAERFGTVTEFDALPGKLGEYFETSTDGMKLSLDGIGYDYQLTGACSLPGSGAVHIVYRNQADPDQAISVWIKPIDASQDTLEPGRVYVEAGQDLAHPVIFWRKGDLLYYLVGDSLQDCDKAVQALRQAA
ncbi:MAG: hypothetical protein ACPGYV_12920, partial [Phycisphaeraceae bacterium]